MSDNHDNMQRIPDGSSIFTAEAKAIDLVLDFIMPCGIKIDVLYY